MDENPWSRLFHYSVTGVTRRLGGKPIDEYVSGRFVLAVPSYGSPRTGGHVPKPVRLFMEDYHEQCIGVVGVGNINFGPEFCQAAFDLTEQYNIPLVATVDMVPQQSQKNDIENYLKEAIRLDSKDDVLRS